MVQSYSATSGTPNQLQLTVCCSQAQLETSARPASKAAARRVWTTADKSNKLKAEEPAASSSASASASATDRPPIEEKAQNTATTDKKLWADEPIDPRYIGQDIDLATITEEQIPELRRRAAVAKEEHERLMQEKRERIVAQQQATLEAEIALEELRLQRLRQHEETERLEGPFNRAARETSRDRQRRRDAEAASGRGST